MSNKVYHIIKKRVEGVYLLDHKNDLLHSDNDLHIIENLFINYVNGRDKNDVYIIVSQVPGERYLHILRESK